LKSRTMAFDANFPAWFLEVWSEHWNMILKKC
jgi:hypothetical protein